MNQSIELALAVLKDRTASDKARDLAESVIRDYAETMGATPIIPKIVRDWMRQPTPLAPPLPTYPGYPKYRTASDTFSVGAIS